MKVEIWKDTFWYSFWRVYIDFTARHCFSRVSFEGLDLVPDCRDAAVFFAPTHSTALMDPLMVLLVRPGRPVVFGARSDIFKPGLVSEILRWNRILPIARERNGLSEVARNFDVFDKVVDSVDNGAPFCLFPEGTHYAHRGMLPVKKGIFRIAKMAVERTGKKVYVVPMGLDYQYFFRMMGKAAIRIGEPIDVDDYFEKHAESGEAEVYRGLVDLLQERDLALVDHWTERLHDRLFLRCLLAFLSLPLFVLCATLALPVWLISWLLLRKMEDKAWTMTVNFGCRLLLPLHAPFHGCMWLLLNYYNNLIEDIRK